MEEIDQLQQALGPASQKDVVLAPFTTFKVGGPADLFIEIRDKTILIKTIQTAKKLHIPVTVLGGGSNVLIGDKGIRGLVIKNYTKEISVKGIKGSFDHGESKGTVYVEVDSGVIFNSFVRLTIEEGYEGIEMHLGLPGSVGGAIYMNSKWTHPEGYVGDALHQGTLIKEDGTIETVPKSYFQFAYDTSVLQKTNDILISATFAFKKSTKEELWKRANESIEYRRNTQPQGVFTPGCTFRNITMSEALMVSTPDHTTSAGFLIDSAQLKDKIIGNAKVSPVHANFIVNMGGATAADIVQLIDLIKETVQKKFGVLLEEEIIRLGEF